jgi:hypothetical protein
MHISDASYGVSHSLFTSLVFSNTLNILIENEADVDYNAIKAFLETPEPSGYLDLSIHFRVNFKTQTIDIRGYKLSDSRYIVSKESNTVYIIKNPRNQYYVRDLLARLYHIYTTV